MGGRVKRSNGYKVDEFVASPTEDENLSSEEAGYGSSEAWSSEEERARVATKEEPLEESINRKIDPRILTTSELVAMDNEEKKAKSKAKKAAMRPTTPVKKIAHDTAYGDELDKLIGTDTASEEENDTDVSSFSAATDTDDSEPEDEPKKTNSAKKLPSTPPKPKAFASGIKRRRDDIEADHPEGLDDSRITVHRYENSYNNVSSAFEVEHRANSGVKIRKLGSDDDAVG